MLQKINKLIEPKEKGKNVIIEWKKEWKIKIKTVLWKIMMIWMLPLEDIQAVVIGVKTIINWKDKTQMIPQNYKN